MAWTGSPATAGRALAPAHAMTRRMGLFLKTCRLGTHAARALPSDVNNTRNMEKLVADLSIMQRQRSSREPAGSSGRSLADSGAQSSGRPQSHGHAGGAAPELQPRRRSNKTKKSASSSTSRTSSGSDGTAVESGGAARLTSVDAAASSSHTFGARDLKPALLLQYERRGWLRTRRVLSTAHARALAEAVDTYVDTHRLVALQQRIRVLCPEVAEPTTTITSEEVAMEVLSHTEVGFLQFFNAHRGGSGVLKDTVLGEHLAAMAAELMGVDAVRVYQDCIFVKQPGFCETNWHSDLRMAPFDTNHSITCWLPMRAIRGGNGDSGLVFAEGSHRDFALPFWHDLRHADLEARGYASAHGGALQPGDCTWHSGWTIHCAGQQPEGSSPRAALAISFIADGARTLDTRARSARGRMLHNEDVESYAAWIGDVEPGAPARHALLPLTFKHARAG